MKDLIIDNSNSNVVCYDSVYMNHATDSQIIKLKKGFSKVDIIEVLCRIWDFNNNEKAVYKCIVDALFHNITPIKHDIANECAINTGKNIVTYTRAIDNLQSRGALTITIKGHISLNYNYDIYTYLNSQRDRNSIKYITIQI